MAGKKADPDAGRLADLEASPGYGCEGASRRCRSARSRASADRVIEETWSTKDRTLEFMWSNFADNVAILSSRPLDNSMALAKSKSSARLLHADPAAAMSMSRSGKQENGAGMFAVVTWLDI